MPDPLDYEAAAAVLDDAAAALGDLLLPARSLLGRPVLAGGQLTDIVIAELDAADQVLGRAGPELTALADTCRERAEAARQYLDAAAAHAVEVGRYESDLRQLAATDALDPLPPPTSPGAAPVPPEWLSGAGELRP